MRRPIYVIDSFSTGPFTGNPAAVLLDGSTLSDAQLQQIAFEMRHSETAFVLPARDPAASFHLRWLTPKAEVRFCGHATLAALAVMAGEAGRIRVPEKGTARFTFSSKAGLLRAEVSRDLEPQSPKSPAHPLRDAAGEVRADRGLRGAAHFARPDRRGARPDLRAAPRADQRWQRGKFVHLPARS